MTIDQLLFDLDWLRRARAGLRSRVGAVPIACVFDRVAARRYRALWRLRGGVR